MTYSTRVRYNDNIFDVEFTYDHLTEELILGDITHEEGDLYDLLKSDVITAMEDEAWDTVMCGG